MHRFLLQFSVLFLAITVSCTQASTTQDIYISPHGNDNNKGDENSPVLTLTKAAELALKSTEEKPITIYLSGGTYFLSKPLKLGIENSNVHWKAVESEQPILSGGKQVVHWKQEMTGLLSAQLDGDFPDKFRELFVSNKRVTRSRHPNNGYLHISKVGEDGRTNFQFKPNDILKVKNPNELELIFLHDWSISRINVKSIDWNENRLTTVDWVGAKVLDFFHMSNWEKQPRYFLENALEFVDDPGEWFYDSPNKKIYYYPKQGETASNIDAVIPTSSQLIKITGNRQNREKVKNISFEGITFEYSNWQLPENGYCGIQACMFDNRSEQQDGWNQVPAAIELDLASNCNFNNCIIRHTGGSGIWFREETENCAISNSHLYDISGNGINIGEGQDRVIQGDQWWKSAPQQVTKNTTVSNCLIEQCGQQFYGSIGIWGGLVANTKIIGNEIRNLPYTGISVGWMWSPEATPCKENIISGNHIHHILNKLSDGGGIYNLGLQRNSVISNNLIHDVKLNTGRAESNGMFLDEGITGVVVENNIVYNIARSPLRFHKATKNIVRNNIFACDQDIPPIRYNRTEESDIQKIDNIILQQNNSEDWKKLNDIIEKRKSEFGPTKQF